MYIYIYICLRNNVKNYAYKSSVHGFKPFYVRIRLDVIEKIAINMTPEDSPTNRGVESLRTYYFDECVRVTHAIHMWAAVVAFYQNNK